MSKMERLKKLKKEEEELENEIKMKEKYLKEKQSQDSVSNSNSPQAYYPSHSHVDSSYLQHIPQTYHYQSYYPYYHYYWYYCDDYSSQYPQYFSYFTHHHPTVQKLTYGPLVLGSGQLLSLNNYSHRTSHFNLQKTGLTLRECRNGPKYYFTVKVNGKIFRVFLGDVNDFFNVQCLYMMSAVVSIGQVDHAEKLVDIYDNPSKRIRYGREKLTVNPFENTKLIPLDPSVDSISRNVKILSFDLENSRLPRKEIVFYHKRDLTTARSEDIFRELAQNSKSGNVLYIVDHLQRSSMVIFRHFLVRYRRFSPRHIHRIRYKRFNLFPRGFK